MILKSYQSLGEFNFTDNLEQIKNKLEVNDLQYTLYPEDDRYKTIKLYVDMYGLIILFSSKGKSILCFEVFEGGKLIFNNENLFEASYKRILQDVSKVDNKVIISDEDFNSLNSGLLVACKLEDGEYTDAVNNVLVYSQDYMKENYLKPAYTIE